MNGCAFADLNRHCCHNHKRKGGERAFDAFTSFADLNKGRIAVMITKRTGGLGVDVASDDGTRTKII